MAIYTSYFSNYRNFPTNHIVVSITQFSPRGWKSLELKSLAPAVNLLTQYKNKEIDEFTFSAKYLNQISHDLNFKARIIALLRHLDKEYGNVILCCYEKSNDFCHRQLLRQWLNGELEIKELGE